MGEYNERKGPSAGARRYLEQLAADVRRECRPCGDHGTVRSRQPPRLLRPIRRRWLAAARGPTAGARDLRKRPESRGGTDLQGDCRNPAKVRRATIGKP